MEKKSTPLMVLEEQVARQRSILASSYLVRKLPDKGVKLKESISKLEAEIEKEKKNLANEAAKASTDVGNLEWALWGSQTVQNNEESIVADETDSADDDEIIDETRQDENTFKILASSQITQRQPKSVLKDDGGFKETITDACNNAEQTSKGITHKSGSANPTKNVQLDNYVANVIERDRAVPRESKFKFVPAKATKCKQRKNSDSSSTKSQDNEVTEDNGKPTPAETSSNGDSKERKKSKKYDECLLLPQHHFESAKVLTMEETMNIGCEKYAEVETLKATAPPKKIYAYDKLKHDGTVERLTVAMQTSRPVKPDIEDEDDDLSDDQISEESESSDEETQDISKTNNDLSNLLSSSMKIS